MEPLAALAIATSVVQFVDFSSKLLSKAKNYHQDGSVVEHRDLSTVTEDLKSLTIELEASLSRIPSGGLSDDQKALQELCRSCLGVADELTEALKKLDLGSGSSRWKSLRTAFKAVCGKERLAELKAKLDIFSQQIDRRLLIDLRAKIDPTGVENRAAFDRLHNTTQFIITRLNDAEVKAQEGIAQTRESEVIIVSAVQDSTNLNAIEHERKPSVGSFHQRTSPWKSFWKISWDTQSSVKRIASFFPLLFCNVLV
ncbi:hypothetical protein ABW19_dt0209715 [Dactylella cylindrospora]|nr:hypothetical protein ABW19_dt0209715 [Dactylella cylindrospora]